MNKCYWCGKFRPWDRLVFRFLPEPGSPAFEPREILECREDCP